MTTRFTIRLLVPALLLLSLVAYGLTGPVSSFTGAFDSIDIKLNWELPSEAGVSGFELYRRTGTETTFRKLADIQPTGAGIYQYTDRDLYKTTDALGTFNYKLTVNTNSGEFNYAVTLSQSPSAVERSWGSIKSMFR